MKSMVLGALFSLLGVRTAGGAQDDESRSLMTPLLLLVMVMEDRAV